MEKWVYTNDDFNNLLSILQSENPINEDVIFVIRQATETLTITEKNENLTPLTPLEKEKLFFIVLLLLQANEIVRWQGQDSTSFDSNIRDIIKVATELTKLLTDLFRNKSTTLHQLNYIFNLSNKLQECNDRELKRYVHFQNFEKLKNITRQKFGGMVIKTVPLSDLNRLSNSSYSDLNMSNINFNLDNFKLNKKSGESQLNRTFTIDEKSGPSQLNRTFTIDEKSGESQLRRTFTIDETISPIQLNNDGSIDQLNRTFTIEKTNSRQEIDQLNRTFNIDGRNPRQGIVDQLNKTFNIDGRNPRQGIVDQLNRTFNIDGRNPRQGIVDQLNRTFTIDERIKPRQGYDDLLNRNRIFTMDETIRGVDGETVDPWYNAEVTNELNIELERVLSENHNKETTSIVKNIQKRICDSNISKLSKREIYYLVKRLRQEMELALFREQVSASTSPNFNITKKIDYTSKFDILAPLKNKTSPDGDIVDPRYNVKGAREVLDILEREFSDEETINIINNIRETFNNLHHNIQNMRKSEIDAFIKMLIEQLELALVSKQEQRNIKNRNQEIKKLSSTFDIIHKIKNKKSLDKETVDPRYNTERIREVFGLLERESIENHSEETRTILKNIKKKVNYLYNNYKKISKHGIDDIIKTLMEQLESAILKEQASKSSESNVKNRNLETNHGLKFTKSDTAKKHKEKSDNDVVDPRYNTSDKANELNIELKRVLSKKHNKETTNIVKNIQKRIFKSDIPNFSKRKIDYLFKNIKQDVNSALAREQEQASTSINSNINNRNPEIDYTAKFDILARLKNKTSSDGDVVDPRYNINRAREVLDVIERESLENHNEETMTIINNIRETFNNLDDNIKNMSKREIDSLITMLIEQLESSLTREQSFVGSTKKTQGNYRNHPHHREACSNNKVKNKSEEINDLKIKLEKEKKKSIILHDIMTNILKDQNSLINKLCNEDKQSGKELQQIKAQTDVNESLKMFKYTVKLLEDFVNKSKEKLSEITEEIYDSDDTDI